MLLATDMGDSRGGVVLGQPRSQLAAAALAQLEASANRGAGMNHRARGAGDRAATATPTSEDQRRAATANLGDICLSCPLPTVHMVVYSSS